MIVSRTPVERVGQRIVHSSWGYPRSFAFRHASDTSHALASSVIVGSLPGRGAIIERSERAFGHGALDAALDRLMMQTERPTDRKKNDGSSR